MTPLKPSTAIKPPSSSMPARPSSPESSNSPLASPSLSETQSDHSSHTGSEHTTSNFNLGRRYRPTPLPTPSLETPGAPPPAFPVPGGLAMTTPAVEGARTALAGPKDEIAEASEPDGSSPSEIDATGEEEVEDDDDYARVGSTLVRRTTGKGFKVREEHQRSDEERRGKASEKIEASRQKARQAKLEERRGSSPTSLSNGHKPAPLAPPEPLVQPTPQNSGNVTPSGTTVVDDEADTQVQIPEQKQSAAGTPEHEKPAKDYKREMRKHLQSMMGSFVKMSTNDKPSDSPAAAN